MIIFSHNMVSIGSYYVYYTGWPGPGSGLVRAFYVDYSEITSRESDHSLAVF